MTNTLIIFRNELVNFARSDRGVFAVYFILVAVWSVLLATNMHQMAFESSALWWIFFSVIVSGNFSNTVFVSERLNGSMEILLTCGLSRVSILAGKILYIVVMSVIFGFLCLGFSLFGSLGTGLSPIVLIKAAGGGITVLLYLFACFMNAACGAWLSMRLPNPRLSHFANLFVLGIMVGGHSALAAFVDCPSWLLPALLLFFGVIFMFMAVRDFEGEHAIQPFSF